MTDILRQQTATSPATPHQQAAGSAPSHHEDDMPLRVKSGGPTERGPVAAQMPERTIVLEEHHDD